MTVNNCSIKNKIDFDSIRKKRMELLIQTWELLSQTGYIDNKRFEISPPLLNEIVEHYVDDVRILKCRYKINEKIQLHKIAGLMTAIILRYRPVVPLVQEYNNPIEAYSNEIFAIMHGLAICGEYSLEECEKLSKSEWFSPWLNDFLYLLHSRNHTPESLVFVYQTLAVFVFPENFEDF